MISFKEAHQIVLGQVQDFGVEEVPIQAAMGRVLANDIFADRHFPPFDRAVKDGIAIRYEAFATGHTTFKIVGVQAAGVPPLTLDHIAHGMEIMTGAVVPHQADTVVMYEDIVFEAGWATLKRPPTRGQEIHLMGSDKVAGERVLARDTRIGAAEIGILATVGQATVVVKRLPRVAIVSTGDELVAVTEQPLPHQIRKSNIHTLYGALAEEEIRPGEFHLADDRAVIREELTRIFKDYEVVLLSGGVSKGKFDYLPEVLEELRVEKRFHRVAQKPGKPFWFGKQEESGVLVFSFPGNPVSTFVNYLVYFKDWLNASLGAIPSKWQVVLTEDITPSGDLTELLRVKLIFEEGRLLASPVRENGSGDLASLAWTDGFIVLDPECGPYQQGQSVPFVPARRLG